LAREEELQQTAEDAQQDRVAVERLADARLDHLEDHRVAVPRGGAMGLGDRGRAQRLGIDPGEELVDRSAQILGDQFAEAL
jgi:hypothetical protein